MQKSSQFNACKIETKTPTLTQVLCVGLRKLSLKVKWNEAIEVTQSERGKINVRLSAIHWQKEQDTMTLLGNILSNNVKADSKMD